VNNEIELVALAKNEKEVSAEAQTLLQIKFDKGNCLLLIFVEGYFLDHS
jgi:hypothetical protein